MDVVSYVLAKKQASNVGFPEDSKSGKVLSIDANGNRVWSYPLVMDATLTEGYQAKLNNSGIPEELFVIDIAKPQFGTFVMKPNYFTYICIKNRNTILVNSFSIGIVDKLEIELINESGVSFSSLAFNGAATRYYYSIVENTWNQSTTRYSGSKLDTLLSEKISFNNETEFVPVEAYNPATKKYVDDSIANIAERAQADWSQNDPNASDYVKNRPFYEGYKILGTFLRGENKSQISLTVGKSYIVDCDGVTYTVVCEQLSNGKGLRLFKEGTVDAIFLFYEDTQYVEQADRVVVMEPDELVVHKLNEKFIPDTIARVSDIGEAASTDDEIIDMLIQEDMLFAFTDSTGSILTDENNNILTW